MPTINRPQKKEVQNINKEERQKEYNSKKWKIARENKLQNFPVCEICLEKEIVTAATQVHHISSPFDDNLTPEQREYLLIAQNNLISICPKCHGELHGGGVKQNKSINLNSNDNK